MTAPRQIDVYLVPSLAGSGDLAGRTVVVIDVLRATTTIVEALAAGALEVVPCLEVVEAQQIATRQDGHFLLGGERGGRRIAGFDLGNSPAEFRPERVRGRSVIFTTTNGTRALIACKSAARVLIGAFVNFSAICHALAEEAEIALVCAGTDGHVTREDTLFAGAVVDELLRVRQAQSMPSDSAGALPVVNDQAAIAADAWRSAAQDLSRHPLERSLRESRGGRNLIEIGQENDIDLAAQIDRFDLVPELDLNEWRIRLPIPASNLRR